MKINNKRNSTQVNR